jgi:hypothetical protein
MFKLPSVNTETQNPLTDRSVYLFGLKTMVTLFEGHYSFFQNNPPSLFKKKYSTKVSENHSIAISEEKKDTLEFVDCRSISLDCLILKKKTILSKF